MVGYKNHQCCLKGKTDSFFEFQVGPDTDLSSQGIEGKNSQTPETVTVSAYIYIPWNQDTATKPNVYT